MTPTPSFSFGLNTPYNDNMSNYQLSSNKHMSYKGLSPRVYKDGDTPEFFNGK